MTAWLYPILTEKLIDPASFADVAATLAGRGVERIQLRLKVTDDRDAVLLHAAVADRLARWSGTLIINDRADLAALLGRHSRAAGHAHRVGLHLGQTDLPIVQARAIVGDDVAIGLSTHDLDQLRLALATSCDHVAFGPVFGTRSKDDPDPVVGLSLLAQAALMARAEARPLVAIGGIDEFNVAAVLNAGASSVAVIGALFQQGLASVSDSVDRLVAAASQDPTRSAS